MSGASGVKAIRRTGLWIIRIAPLHCPHRTEAAISEAVIPLRRRFPHLGPRKLRVVLERQARDLLAGGFDDR